MSFVRAELYSLCDGRWPTGIKFERDDEDEEGASRPCEHLSGERLRNGTFILAAGTFQSFYEARASTKSIGFHEPSAKHFDGPNIDAIVEAMPRELSNRFGHFIYLPELAPNDYHHLARQAETELPEWIVPAFRRAAAKRIPQAIAAKSGCRFVELALAEALQTWQHHGPPKKTDSLTSTPTSPNP